ncbi:MAG: hypothetical protein Kow00106_19080 [Anaerolineae bacterium]
MNRRASQSDPVARHRRAVRRHIIAPVAGAGLGLLVVCGALIVAVGMGTLEDTQITTVMGLVATAFIALPLAILCLVPYALLAALAALSGHAYTGVRGPLRSLRRQTERLAVATTRVAPRLAAPFVALNVKVTRWEYMLRGQPPQALPVDKETTHD